MKDFFTLPDGAEISWDEFSNLSEIEQNALLKAQPKQQPVAREQSVSPNDIVFPRLTAIAKRSGVSEDEFLHYLQTMHELIFGCDAVEERGFSSTRSNVGSSNLTNTSLKGKPVETPIGAFPSINAAAQAYEVDRQTMTKWLLKHKAGFSFVNPEHEVV